MAIKIIRNEDGNCVNFLGADTPVYWNACLTAFVNFEQPDNIDVRNNIKSDGGDAYEFFNEAYTSFVDENGDPFASAASCVSYINQAANAAGVFDIGAGYKGVWNASTNNPDITTNVSGYINGDWFYVETAGTIVFNSIAYALNVNDIVKFNITSGHWEVIRNANVSIANIEGSALDQFDIHVDPSFTGDVRTGSSLQPYTDLAVAIANSSADQSILIKGEVVVPNSSSDAFVLPHGLEFYGNSKAVVRFASYDATNGDLFHFAGTDNTQKFLFEGLTIKNAGGYGIFTDKTARTEIRDSTLTNNGWNGIGLHTILSSTVSGVLGYDSTSAALQAFYAGSNASNGGAARVQEATSVFISNNLVTKNLRGIRVQDCGINGGGFITRNQVSQNIESGIYLAAGSLGGCHNVVAAINSSAYNANNGLLCIGGINNKFSQNEVNGNWNGGAVSWGSGNWTLRDCGLYDNNRSEFNGIGNVGDAQASIMIDDAYNMLGTIISVNPDARFIAEVLDTQIHYTGLGSNTSKVGVYLGENLSLLTANDKNIIKIDDVGFIGQDYAFDLSDVNTSNLKLMLGDNSYSSLGQTAVKPPLAGDYYELPFGNHVTDLNAVDIEVDNTGSVIVREGPTGVRLNPYKVNDLVAVAHGQDIKFLLKHSNKIQFTVPVSGCSIGGSFVNSVLNQALVQINGVLTNTTGFASGGNPVSNFTLVGDDLTITLSDSTSFTVDVTTLGVDENKFVSSGTLVGSDLVLTMTDSTTVTIDAQNMINGSTLSSSGQGWFVAYGSNAGTEITTAVSDTYSTNNAPLYFGQKLEVGTEFVWSQYHLVSNPNRFMSIGVWAGITNDASPTDSTAVTNWSTKFGFYANTLTEDTSTLANGGYSSKNTDIAAGTTYANGTLMRLVYGADYRLRLYADDVLIASSLVAETGADLDIHMTSANTSVEFPSIIKRTTNWEIVHDFDNSENGDILDGIEEDTVLQTVLEISPGEKAMVDLSNFGRSHRIGLNYTGASTGISNPYSNVSTPIVYGTSEQIIAQNAGEWSFNSSALYYTNSGNGKWNVPSANAGMVSFRYHSDNSVDLYSETYQEVIATRLTNLLGSAFKVSLTANENVPNFGDLPTVSKQTIGQSFQPRTNYAPTVADQSVSITEAETLNYQIVSSDYIVNQFVAENAPSWMTIDQNTGVLGGVAPAYAGTSADNIVVNCKAGNAVGGVTNFTVTINVTEFVYTNTKSLRFAAGSNAYLVGNAANMNVMQRATNGTGASDAWSIAMWIRPGGNSATSHILNYGTDSTLNAGGVMLTQQSINNLVMTYGSGANYIGFAAVGVFTPTQWHHVLLTYDGGTTGAASGSLSAYYSRFKLVIDGVVISPTFLQSNYGYTGSIPATNFFIGKNVFGSNPLQYARINQMAFWGSNQFANRSALYNGGATMDLTGLGTPPDHYYEIEDSVTTIEDLTGNADLTGYNLLTTDLVNDVP